MNFSRMLLVNIRVLCCIFIEFQFSIISANAETDLLSKFHQTDYKIEFQRMELGNYDKSLWNFVDIKTYKYNRTTPVANLTLNPKQDFGDKTEIVVQAYKFLSNEYRTFPMRFQVNACKCIDRNIAGSQSLYKCGNFTECKIKKDVTYRMCNFGVDQSRLPPLLPNGDFRLQLEFVENNKLIMTLNVFAKIYRPISSKHRH